MEIKEGVRKLVEVFKVANDDVIGNTARQILNLKWKEGLSARNQAHKILDELALTNRIKKGKGFYSAKDYQGEYREHDRAVSEHIARLILARLPLTLYREVSFPVGLRSDIVALIGRNGKGVCAVIEVCINESVEYLNKKAVVWSHWEGTQAHLSNLFNVPVPHFSLVSSGLTHPAMMDFEDFLKEVQQ